MTYPLVAELAEAGIPVTVSCRVLKLARRLRPRARAAECDCRRSARVACRGHQRLAAFTARGWVEVRPHHSDGRTNLVSLTAAGADLITAAWQGLAASDVGADDGVDLVQLQRSLERVIGNAERHVSQLDGGRR